VKFAPVFTLERFNDPRWNRTGRTLYESGAFEFPPNKDTIPLLIDHEDDREIGTVHSLFKMDWIDGPWICARATVTDPPEWLKRGRVRAIVSTASRGQRGFLRSAYQMAHIIERQPAASRKGEVSCID
jgi:hypothetical protein